MHSPPFDKSHVNDMSKTATVVSSWVLQGTVYWANEITGLLLLKGDSLTMVKPLSVGITENCGKSLKKWEYHTTLPASWEICMQVKNQQLEPDMELTGSK